jgi:hypothetical protein
MAVLLGSKAYSTRPAISLNKDNVRQPKSSNSAYSLPEMVVAPG